MRVSGTIRFVRFLSAIALSPLFAGAFIDVSGAQTQPSLNQVPDPSIDESLEPVDPNTLRPLNLDSSIFSLQGGKRLMEEAGSAINTQDYGQAIAKLQQARQVFNQLSNFYQELAASFSGIDNRIASTLRRQAVETAEMRDQATYQLTLAHRGQNQLELAVPLLIQVIRSQNPTRDLGKQAYQQLFELGFVNEPLESAESDNRSSSLSNSILSIQGGERLMAEVNAAINTQNYAQAIAKLQQARQVFNQLSNFYQELAASFTGINTRIADDIRRQAVQTAEMRDQATYQLALVHRAQSEPELAVPLLIQIIRSQNPTRDLGKKAYQQLFELGFVDSPYPRPRSNSTSLNP